MKKRLSQQKGQGLMEYIMITFVVSLACLGALTSFGDVLEKRVTYMQREVVRLLKLK